MKPEDKKLLLKDFCARAPHGLLIYVNGHDEIADEINPFEGTVNCGFQSFDVEECKPYLRPLSSMTAEEKEELKTLFDAEDVTSDSICYLEGGTLEEYLSHISFSFCADVVDWLNKYHFDYRGLIPKDLAIEVTEEIKNILLQLEKEHEK